MSAYRRPRATAAHLVAAVSTALLTVGLAATGLAGCSADQTAGTDAVAQGGNGSFNFYSPGGKLEITYPPEERAPVQDFSAQSLMGEEGTTIALSDFAGKVVVLNAWGQWCAPCRAEVDDLEEVQEAIAPKGATVLGINVRDNNRQVAQDFVKDNAVSYPSLYDPPFRTGAALGGLPTSVVPTTVVLDKQHRPAAVFLRTVSSKEIIDLVNQLVAEP
ncbi:TlpA disulfide reductase family protein [Corynebacterium uberis]|uniref:TlpA disulfide reductase family protein n=1 Tax=Corynebacterium TaxID=1716 RepID=UPI001D0ACDAB|nr:MULTISPECIES: TlpA disulfide reductase family protein [Corynebacterium]MCZ9309499.1 TlpA family protein disulfide reductase [Corynebacterium sp. c6VSa_13]UDL73048.1 TlpA family protein disulfide reductase [Corynebacterium uberis]UDL76075.1 TlpA family protein disulfide reductase [Corynebacterium uberis]UDL78287.1 TlpA family protein disulfide reductase [Corynebacterium uberis]UDL80570.1 TlpA family protein disulfide reductase [Corynebacterium uberis]